MSDDHDDLLFEINDGDYGDGTLNEDELLLSDEDHDELDDELNEVTNKSDTEEPLTETEPVELSSEPLPNSEETTDTGQSDSKEEEEQKETSEAKSSLPDQQPIKPPTVLAPRQPFRQKFQRWPNQPPRWNHPSQQHQQQMPFSRGPNQILRPPGGHMRQGGPGPQRHPGPFPPNHPQFFNNNNFMQGRPPMRPPIVRQRFFYPNQQPIGDPAMQGSPAYVPSPIMGNSAPVMPRKVLINPNFKGGVEAAKNQLMKDQFFSSGSALPEDELLRKQQEFINHNMRQIEKRRHERTPSPEYRRGYSHSPSPPRHRRRPFKNYDRRRNFGDNEGKGKDENLPEEDEETRAYRQQIESQRKKREEILRQKEMRRRQLAEQKAKETQPAEPLQPIVVTDKKIVLKRKSPDKSTTPPIKDAPVTPSRRIVLKPSKEMKGIQEVKPALADGSKRKIQKILNS